MNLIESIARGLVQGLSHAAIAAKLEAEHAVQVGEAWVAKIVGADGFSAVLGKVRAEVETAMDDGKTEVSNVVKAVEGTADDSPILDTAPSSTESAAPAPAPAPSSIKPGAAS